MNRTRTVMTIVLGLSLAGILITTPAWAPPPGQKGDKGATLERVIFLSGDAAAAVNGAALLEAIGDIGTDGPCSAPAPSAVAPCLIKLGPGTYDLQTSSLFMIDHVDIEGSGEGVTVVTGAPADGMAAGLLIGAEAELRHLTVENTRSDATAVEVRAILTGGSDMRISRVTAIASGANNTAGNGNVAIAVLGGGGAPILTGVTAIAEPQGGTPRAIVAGDGSAPLLIDTRAVSSHTALGLAGPDDELVTVRNSVLRGGAFSIVTTTMGNKEVHVHASQLEGSVSAGGANVVNLGASQLDGMIVPIGAPVNCVYVYSEAFAPHACSSP